VVWFLTVVALQSVPSDLMSTLNPLTGESFTLIISLSYDVLQANLESDKKLCKNCVGLI